MSKMILSSYMPKELLNKFATCTKHPTILMRMKFGFYNLDLLRRQRKGSVLHKERCSLESILT